MSVIRSIQIALVGVAMALLSACGSPAGKDSVSQPEASAAPLSLHVNQFGFDTRAAKSAVVVLNLGVKASTFTLLDQNKQVVLSGELKPLQEFTEWGANKRYFSADFSALKKPGFYRVRVEGEFDNKPMSATSPEFEVLDNLYFKRSVADVLAYFKANRHTDAKDRHIRIFDTDRYADVYGGWMDAGGDTGKYLSHLSYANFMNPQQGAIVSWALAKSYQAIPTQYEQAGLERALLEETLWGADYLHRILDNSGAFYMTVFDQWGYGDERVITAYTGLDGIYTENWQAAFREGGGIAIAALARAYGLSQSLGKKLKLHGEFSAEQYLADAERAFAHLQKNNPRYCDDGTPNMIDDYTALIAATELYRVTEKSIYLKAMQQRVDNLNRRMTDTGWFVSDDDARPYYHGVEAGMPILALVDYLNFDASSARAEKTRATLKKALDYQLQLNREVVNPFNYARQTFKAYLPGGQISAWAPSRSSAENWGEQTTGFFMPHANESGYWWQGESARLASLSAAAIWGGRVTHPDTAAAYGVAPELSQFAQNQLDWILGRNPFDMCMLYGFGANNPPYSESGGSMVKGGISNGITGASNSPLGRGITWAEGPEENNWRWVEQWLQHSTWYLLGLTAMTEADIEIKGK